MLYFASLVALEAMYQSDPMRMTIERTSVVPPARECWVSFRHGIRPWTDEPLFPKAIRFKKPRPDDAIKAMLQEHVDRTFRRIIPGDAVSVLSTPRDV